jgi:hypothetical protein
MAGVIVKVGWKPVRFFAVINATSGGPVDADIVLL